MTPSTIAGKPAGGVGYNLVDLTKRWIPLPREEACKAMKAALEAGANFWHGGQFYGSPENNSLHLLHEYFSLYPEDANKVVLCVKGDYDAQSIASDWGVRGVMRSLEKCLRILDGTKKIDVFECARLDPKVPVEVTMRMLAEFVRTDKIGGIALCDVDAETICRAHAVHHLAAVEVELSMFAIEPLIQGVAYTCKELGIPLLARCPTSQGFLSREIRKVEDIREGDARRFAPRFQRDVFEENLKLVEAVEHIADVTGCAIPQVATAWVRAHEALPMPAGANVEQVVRNCTLVDLTEDDLEEVHNILDEIHRILFRMPRDHRRRGSHGGELWHEGPH